jgi:bifunctional DNA-binding transcriptional regulator/antitoxin component of YhaV-PrlF toxin-antitoxin module
MATTETVHVGQDGDVPLPQSIRERAGIDAGSTVTLEARNGVIIVRASDVDVEIYTPQRRAEFLLSNAVDANEYAVAREEVRQMGIDPDDVPHHRPAGA